jgi:hypothetical protein
MDRTHSRRDFMRTLATGAAATLASSELSRARAQSPKWVGIQIGPHSLYDEGIERVLDLLQESAGVNTLLVYSHTYYTADDIRLKRSPGVLATDHGVPVRDIGARDLPYVWVRHHEEYFKATVLRHPPPGKEQEYSDRDLFSELAETVRRRGMKLYARVLEPFRVDTAEVIPNWVQVMTVDVFGRTGEVPCWNHPDYRNWWLATVEDLFKSYELDGFQWGAERVGPLSNLLYRGTTPYCFCPHCRARCRDKGIDVERARQGLRELHDFVQGLLSSEARPVDGVLTTLFRHFFQYPEILAWERQWRESKEELFAQMCGSIKAIVPAADVGRHIDHPGSTFDLLYRAEWSYAEMARTCDFIKPILYHDIAGPRLRYWYLDRLQKTILSELSLEQSTELFYALKGYDRTVEPRLDELGRRGFTPDYVYRETKRCVEAVGGRAKIYAGIGIDIPWNYQERVPSDPENVYRAVMRAFEAGASGVLASREYDEMRLAGLRAFGRAVRESHAVA